MTTCKTFYEYQGIYGCASTIAIFYVRLNFLTSLWYPLMFNKIHPQKQRKKLILFVLLTKIDNNNYKFTSRMTTKTFLGKK